MGTEGDQLFANGFVARIVDVSVTSFGVLKCDNKPPVESMHNMGLYAPINSPLEGNGAVELIAEILQCFDNWVDIIMTSQQDNVINHGWGSVLELSGTKTIREWVRQMGLACKSLILRQNVLL